MTLNRKKPSLDVIQELYILWLKGKSLRALTSYLFKHYQIKVNHSTIGAWFQVIYGDDATDPVACSLARSLLEDYEDNPEVQKWVIDNLQKVRGTQHHRSNHSMNQLTKYQTVREDGIMDYLLPTGADAWESINEEEDLSYLRGTP